MKPATLLFPLLLSLSAAAAVPCNLTPSAPRGQLMSCTIKHQETAGGIVTRVFGVFVPTNYSPGQSFLVLKIGGTTHKIAGDCPLQPAGPESSGWLSFAQTVPTAAPVILCPQAWLNTGTTDNGERWQMWGYENAPYNGTWVNGVIPNDQDFLDTIVPLVIAGLQLKPQIAVTNDWNMTSIVASEFAARRPDLVSVLALYNDATFANIALGPNGEMVDSDSSVIPPPAGPLSAIFVESYLPKAFYASQMSSMCGSATRAFTADDRFAYWASAIQPTSVITDDLSGANTLFCSSRTPTTLEAKLGTGGINGTEIQMYKLVGNTYATPPCSYSYSGVNDPSMCNTATHLPANYNFIDPNATCTTSWPCNHFMPQPTLLQLFYSFMQAHIQ